MVRKKVLRDEVRLWLEDSKDSFKVAKENYGLGNYHVSAFYLHSAVERALKATIVAVRLRAPPKTHNLVTLYADVRGEVKLSVRQSDFLAELTPVHQTARYVDIAMSLPRDIYSQGLVKRYLRSTTSLLRTLRKVLGA